MISFLEPHTIKKMFDHWGPVGAKTLVLSSSSSADDYKDKYKFVKEISLHGHGNIKTTGIDTDLLFLAAQDLDQSITSIIPWLSILQPGGLAILELPEGFTVNKKELSQLEISTNIRILYGGKKTGVFSKIKDITKAHPKKMEILILEKNLHSKKAIESKEVSIVLPYDNAQKVKSWTEFILKHELETKLEIITIHAQPQTHKFIKTFQVNDEHISISQKIRYGLCLCLSQLVFIDINTNTNFHHPDLMDYILLYQKYSNPIQNENDIKYSRQPNAPFIIKGECTPSNAMNKYSSNADSGFYLWNMEATQYFFRNSHPCENKNQYEYINHFLRIHKKNTIQIKVLCTPASMI